MILPEKRTRASRESQIERYLKTKIENLGGTTRKVKWIGINGAPDRLVLFKGAHWVELKRPGASLKPQQNFEHILMSAHGVKVHVLDSLEAVDMFVEALKTGKIKKCFLNPILCKKK